MGVFEVEAHMHTATGTEATGTAGTPHRHGTGAPVAGTGPTLPILTHTHANHMVGAGSGAELHSHTSGYADVNAPSVHQHVTASDHLHCGYSPHSYCGFCRD